MLCLTPIFSFVVKRFFFTRSYFDPKARLLCDLEEGIKHSCPASNKIAKHLAWPKAGKKLSQGVFCYILRMDGNGQKPKGVRDSAQEAQQASPDNRG